MMRLLCLVLLCCCCQAHELALRDIGLRIDALGGDFDFTVDGESGSDGFDSAYGFGLQFRYSLAAEASNHGPVIGADLLHEEYSYGNDGDLRVNALRFFGGYAYAITPRAYCYGGSWIDLGMADLNLDAALGGAGSYDGNRFGLGLEAVAGYHLNHRWTVFLRLGYGYATYDLSGDDPGSVELESLAGVAGIGISWRFDTLPTVLD